MNFEIDKIYKRTKLHDEYGGNFRNGISPSRKFPLIFIFTDPFKKTDIYEDKWEDDLFLYSGEGKVGDMKFDRGNKSIRDHHVNGERLFLFEKTKKSGYWTFIDEFKYDGYEFYDCKDINGKPRRGIQFKLLSITKDSSKSIENDHDKGSKEGRIIYKTHKSFERDGSLPIEKKNKVLKELGYLSCEVCDFNFTDKYGDRGRDYIECHHNIPISELNEGDVTKLSDLSLLCSNCHRMIHRKKPWLSIDELKEIIN